jgi:hypothetical protein
LNVQPIFRRVNRFPLFKSPAGRINVGPELACNFLFYVRVQIDQVAHGLVGVKNFAAGMISGGQSQKRRLASGDPARDPDGGHVTFYRPH